MAKSCRTSPSVHHCTVAPPTPYAGGRGVVHGKVKGGGNSLKTAASGLIPAKREANSSLIEATTLTQVSGSTSSGSAHKPIATSPRCDDERCGAKGSSSQRQNAAQDRRSAPQRRGTP